MAEFRKRFFQMIGQHRHSQQIRGCPLIVRTGGFGAKFVPILDISVAASEPSEGNKIDLRTGSSVRSSGTERMPSSLALEPDSGSVTPSLASNRRALATMTYAFSGEIDRAGRVGSWAFCASQKFQKATFYEHSQEVWS
jgi:hypothetical protein